MTIHYRATYDGDYSDRSGRHCGNFIVVTKMLIKITTTIWMVALILQSWNKFYSRNDHFGRSHKAGLIGIIIAPSTHPPLLSFPHRHLYTCELNGLMRSYTESERDTLIHTHNLRHSNTHSHAHCSSVVVKYLTWQDEMHTCIRHPVRVIWAAVQWP